MRAFSGRTVAKEATCVVVRTLTLKQCCTCQGCHGDRRSDQERRQGREPEHQTHPIRNRRCDAANHPLPNPARTPPAFGAEQRTPVEDQPGNQAVRLKPPPKKSAKGLKLPMPSTRPTSTETRGSVRRRISPDEVTPPQSVFDRRTPASAGSADMCGLRTSITSPIRAPASARSALARVGARRMRPWT